MAVPLSIVYQQSLYQGRIPDAWRQAKVIALYKGKGDKMDPSSYQPISLTAVAYKVLERVVVDKMRHYLESSSLLCNEQYGFIPNRSTVTNLLQCDTIIANHLNERKACDVFMLDFERAFDQVSQFLNYSR